MTDEQIKKALKMCTDEHIGCEDGCPCEYNGMSIARCRMEVMKNALDLINRKDAKVELLTMDVNSLTSERDALQEMVKEQKAEVERLKAEIRNTDNALASLDRPLIEVKHEAYKEFSEGLKNIATRLSFGGTYQYKVVTTEGIEYMLKKLMEGGNEPPKNDFKEEL